MSGLQPPPVPGGPLRVMRCVRHEVREAVARCPECGGFFCRECVVEHTGRLVCADCLAKSVRVQAKPERRWPKKARQGMLLAASFLLVWMMFYGVGSLLLKIPPQLHEGSIWQSNIDQDGGDE